MGREYKRKRTFRLCTQWIRRELGARNKMFATNRWFQQREYSFYLRFGTHYYGGGGIKNTIELCNLTVSDEFRGDGLFTMFVEELERMHGLSIFVENVLQERFREFWRKRGYVEQSIGDISCFLRVASIPSGTRATG